MRIIIGIISSLPKSIIRLNMIFEKAEKPEKLPAEPTSPRAGPALLMQVSTEVKVVVRSFPLKAMRIIEKMKNTR